MVHTLSVVDIGILCILAISMITGLIRGCVKEMIALCAWIIGIILALQFSQVISKCFLPYLHSHTLSEGTAFVVIMISTLLMSSVLNFILSFFLKSSGLIVIDKILGLGFGFVRGVLVISLIMVGMKLAGVTITSHPSYLYGKFTPVVNWIHQFVQPYISKWGAAYEQQFQPLPAIPRNR